MKSAAACCRIFDQCMLSRFVRPSYSRVERICIMAGALVMVASAALAQVAAIRDCPAPPGAVNVALPSGLPPVLRKAMGNIALPGEPFNAIDIYVKGQP